MNYKNILLINAWEPDIFPPPAIGYLKSAINSYFKDEINVTTVNISESLQLLSVENNYDLIGVSFHSFSVKFAKQIREITAGKKLICGGHHPSALPQQLVNLGYDCIVIGEGENAIIDYILGKIDCNIFYGKNATPYYDINTIPFPDYSKISYNHNDSFGIPVISSRGCPFSCNFCASSLFWDRKIKLRDVDSVISEIEQNILKGITSFMFEDDNFTINKNRVLNICSQINGLSEKYKINLTWQCASRADVLIDNDICNSLLNSGCKKVWLGCESFSQDSLSRCAKHTTVDKMIAGITNAENVGLKTMCQFIIGLPGDTIEDIYKTRDLIRSTKISEFGSNITWILPNTHIHKLSLLKGFNNDSYLDTGVSFYTYEQSIETLQHWSNIINTAKQ